MIAKLERQIEERATKLVADETKVQVDTEKEQQAAETKEIEALFIDCFEFQCSDSQNQEQSTERN